MLAVSTLAAALIAPPTPIVPGDDPAHDPAVVIERLVGEGDILPGLGEVTGTYRYEINNQGDWLAQLYVDSPADDALMVVLLNGEPIFVEHDPVPEPAGATIYNSFAIDLNDAGEAGAVLWLYDTVDYTDDHILMVDGVVLAQEGSAPGAAGFSPGTIWQQTTRLSMNDSNQVVMMGEVDDPAFTHPYADALVRYQLAPDGTVASEEIVTMLSMPVVGATETVSQIDEFRFHMNDDGDVFYHAWLDAPNETANTLLINDTVIGRSEGPSVVPGEPWDWSVPTLLDMNNAGVVTYQWATGLWPNATVVLVKGDHVYARPGDVLPTTAPFGIDRIVDTDLNDRGDLLWRADWDQQSSLDWNGNAILLNSKPLALKDSTVVEGKTFDQLGGVASSDNGRWVMFDGETSFYVDALYRIDLGPWSELDGELAGATPAPQLVGIGSLEGGSSMTLRIDDGTPGANAVLVVGFAAANVPLFGTTLVPVPTIVVPNLTLDAAGAFEVNVPWPSGLPSGATVYAQAFVPDATAADGWAATAGIVGVTP